MYRSIPSAWSSFTSLIETVGASRVKMKKQKRKNANEPSVMQISTGRGAYACQLCGRKSCEVEPAMITSRSSHMPMLTRIETTSSAGRLRRRRFHRNASGARTLQTGSAQNSGAIQPVARQKANCRSNGSPEYQEMNGSIA